MNKNINLFSRPIHTGKTTELMNWIKGREDVVGILTPIIDGKRQVYHISTGETRQLDKENGEIQIGIHSYDKNTFQWAIDSMMEQSKMPHQYFIIDEIGPYEIRREKGFYDTLIHLLNDDNLANTQFIIVVRDFMVEEFLEKFNIKEFRQVELNELD